MKSDEIIKIYKKHEKNTTPQVAALITVAEMIGRLNENIEKIVKKIEDECK